MKFRILLLILLLPLFWSCRKSLPKPGPKEKGTLVIKMQVDERVDYLSKASGTTPQPSDLTLEILDGETSVEKFAPIGNANKEISLSPGDYKVRAYSAEFSAPAFDKPVYADEEQVSIPSGGTAAASLECIQSNAGVKIAYSAAFKQAHSDYATEIVQNGLKLAYRGADETRTGYFLPGRATLTLTVDGVSHRQELTLQPQRIYTVNIEDEALPSGSVGINLSINSSYTEENLQVFFPADPATPQPPEGTRKVLFSENFGTKATTDTYLNSYDGWENTSVSYSGTTLMIVKPSSESMLYPDASGGCCLFYSLSNRSFTVSGINTSGATSLVLTFGLSNSAGGTLSASDIEVSVDENESGIPLTLTPTVTAYDKWSLVTVSSGIPATALLTLNITAKRNNMLVDDLRITGIK